jgi:1-hydroxycarotenoid 3,4-desaturase
VAIVGGGIGGLSAAALLSARGLSVTLLERAPSVGGKLRQVSSGGLPIDAGPTVLTLLDVFEAVFDGAGARLSDHLSVKPLAVLARHAWSEGERLDLFADLAASEEAVGRFAGADEARRFRGFSERARVLHDTLDRSFMRAERPNMAQLSLALGPLGLFRLFGGQPFATLWGALGRHFRDPRLRQLFGRYSTYCGSSPFAAPALLMLVAHVERSGVWSVDGGMRRIAEALAGVAERNGAAIRCGAHVEEILLRDGAARGVRLADKTEIAADAVIHAGDAAALADGLLGRRLAGAVPRHPAGRRSLSALTVMATAKTDGFPLVRHNVFFCRDYRREFDEIAARRLPSEPTVYVCAQDRADPEDPAPAGPERLLMIVNAPAVGDQGRPETEEIARCRQAAFGRMEQAGLRLEPAPDWVTTGPQEFAQLFPGSGGAIYGQATHGWFASFRRPGSRSALPGLYLTGGSVHPGAGLPMAALSAIRCADSLLRDLASQRRFRPAAIVGGTSTA